MKKDLMTHKVFVNESSHERKFRAYPIESRVLATLNWSELHKI